MMNYLNPLTFDGTETVFGTKKKNSHNIIVLCLARKLPIFRNRVRSILKALIKKLVLTKGGFV